jgi:hypothetical protein
MFSRVSESGGLIIVAFALLLGCSDATAPNLAPRYVLATVDGSPLPYDLVNIAPNPSILGTGGRQTLLADTLQILNTTDFRRSGSVSTPNLLNQASEITWYVITGFYNVRGNTLTLEWTSYPPTTPPSQASESFTVEGSTVRIKRAVGPRCMEGTSQCADRPLVDFVYVER